MTEMRDCENESNRSRTIGGMEVCAGQMPEGQEESEGGGAPNTSIECPSHHLQRKDSALESKFTRRHLENRCATMLRGRHAKELKHIHNVFEVVWLGDVGSLAIVRSKWLVQVAL